MSTINPDFGSDVGTNKYTPVLYSMRVMRLFVEGTLLHEVCNSDYEGDIKGKGDVVEVRVAPPTLAVQDYVAGVDLDFTQGDYEARSLSIDQAKAVGFQFDEIEKVQSDLGLFNLYAERAAISLDIHMSRDVLTVMATGAMNETDVTAANAAAATNGVEQPWVTGSTGNSGDAAGKVTAGYNLGVYVADANAGNVAVAVDEDSASDYLVDLGVVLDEADVPTEGRFVILPAWYCGMFRKGELKQANITGDATGVIRTGLIGEINNFKIYQSNLVKSSLDDGTVRGFHCVAGVTDAMTFASQVTKTEVTPIENQFGEKWKTLSVYGRKVIQPEALAMFYAKVG